jgi:hypothetical protein
MPDLVPVQRIAKLNCLRFQVRDSASPDSAISVIPSYVHLVAAASDNVGTRAPFPAQVMPLPIGYALSLSTFRGELQVGGT